MPKIKKSKKAWLKFFKDYGIHLWLALILLNAGVLYTVHFLIGAQTCMPKQQVLQDTRCLYIWNDQVFQKGTRSKPYLGYSCGTDISFTLSNTSQVESLLQGYVANACISGSSSSRSTNSSIQRIAAVVPTSSSSPSAYPSLSLMQGTSSASIVPSVSPTDTPTPAPPTPTPSPRGPVIDISFSLPGIGSGGAVLQPLHTTRTATIYMYSTAVNTADKSVQPLYTVKTQATYDTDPNSPTYTSFVNHYVDLGPIANGEYQVVLKSDQTLPQLVKSDPNSVGGETFSFNSNINVIPHQTMYMGDINNDGVMDIADYNAFVDCYGTKADTSSCPNKQAADLDDNGVVDGVDYNLLLLGLQHWLALGFPVPVLSIMPTATPTITPRPTISLISRITTEPHGASSSGQNTILPTRSVTAKPTPVVASSRGSVLGKFFAFLFLIIILGIAVLFALKSKFINLALQKAGISLPVFPLHKNNSSQQDTTQTTSEQPADATATQVAETAPAEEGVSPTVPQSTVEPAIDKTYFVKTKSKDEKGIWVTLTDDNGPIDGFYTGGEITDGFLRIKGVQKTDGSKTYIEISEVLPAE